MTWCSPISTFANDPLGRPIASTLTKRTYQIRADGRLALAEQPLPLDTTDEPLPPGYDPSWRGEIDGAPFKAATDVVVFGKAHAPGGTCHTMQVEVGLPDLGRTIRLQVTGDRHCTYRPHAVPAVSAPEPFETMPLDYNRAYGGVDPEVDFPAPPFDGAEALGMLMMPAGAYPRNPVGVGFATSNRPELIDGLRLPNIERADQPLRPDRIICPGMAMWHQQPMPAGLGWVDPGWFPRCVFGGALPLFEAPVGVAEATMGILPSDFAQRFAPTPEGPRLDYRLFNGASLGLVVPHLRGDEVITTKGLSPTGALNVQLPADRPRLYMRLRGQPMTTELAIHTVGLLAEERLLYVVWRASALLPANYTPRMATLAEPALTGLEDLQVDVL